MRLVYQTLDKLNILLKTQRWLNNSIGRLVNSHSWPVKAGCLGGIDKTHISFKIDKTDEFSVDTGPTEFRLRLTIEVGSQGEGNKLYN